MKRIVLTSLCLFVMGCSNADGIDGQYQRSNATPFEAKYGMAKGLLIEDNGQRATLQHSWGGDVLDVKREDGRLVVLDGGEPEYVIDELRVRDDRRAHRRPGIRLRRATGTR